MKLVRDYENSAKKVVSWKNHLHFNPHCKHHDITPMSLRLVLNVRSEKAAKILRRAERSLLPECQDRSNSEKIGYFDSKTG